MCSCGILQIYRISVFEIQIIGWSDFLYCLAHGFNDVDFRVMFFLTCFHLCYAIKIYLWICECWWLMTEEFKTDEMFSFLSFVETTKTTDIKMNDS